MQPRNEADRNQPSTLARDWSRDGHVTKSGQWDARGGVSKEAVFRTLKIEGGRNHLLQLVGRALSFRHFILISVKLLLMSFKEHLTNFLWLGLWALAHLCWHRDWVWDVMAPGYYSTLAQGREPSPRERVQLSLLDEPGQMGAYVDSGPPVALRGDW